MTQTIESSPDDLSYVRRVAESGARAPLVGGRFLLWWGLLLTLTWTAHHFAIHAEGAGERFAFIWAGFGVIGGLGQWMLGRSMGDMPGEGSAGNRAARAAWAAAALAILSMVVGTAIASATGAGPRTFDWIAPVAFAVYASAQIVSGSLSDNRVITAAGIGAAIWTGLFTALILHPDRYLVAAAGAAIVLVLPGFILLRGEPRARS